MISQCVGLFMFLWIIVPLAAEVEVRAKPGQDVTLQCHIPTDADITLLKWSRPGLDDYVFFFRDNKLYESFQDPRYHGRVKLTDPEMKNGDASVLLKNVDISDTGTYQCWVVTSSNNLRKRDLEVFERSVHLTVSEGPEKEIDVEYYQYGDANDEQSGGPRGHVGMGASLGPVCLVAVVVVVGGLVVKSKRAKVKRSLIMNP